MTRKILMASAIALAAPAFAQIAPATDADAMVNQSGAMTTGEPDPIDVMDHSQHDAAAPINASPTQTTPRDVDGDTDAQMPVEGTMAIDTTGTIATGATANSGTTDVSTAASANASTGVGGPLETATEYPVCTRAITDNCLQTPRSPTPN